MGVNVNEDMEKKLKELGEWIEEKKEGVRMVIGEDFNARTRCSKGVGVEWMGKGIVMMKIKRKSKDR